MEFIDKILNSREDKLVKSLSDYAYSIGKKVYVVGGVVRDALLDETRVGERDIDLAGNLTVQEIVDFLNKLDIKAWIKNKKLGVVAFNYYGANFEYARLRREKYFEADTHTPSVVEFVDGVDEDAKRRDFTANSVYYDRHSRCLIDPMGGVDDIRHKILKPVLGEETLKVDPARIIRFIELVARFNFMVSEKTFNIVKKYSINVCKLTQNRLEKEILRLLIKNKYEQECGYMARVCDMIEELNLQEILKIDNFKA